MKRYSFTVLLLLFLVSGLFVVCADDWVWTPENGWVNRNYAGRSTVGPIYGEAKSLFEERRYDEAIMAFDRVLAARPVGRLREDALFFAAEANYEAGRFYRAHVLYDQLLDEFPGTEKIRVVAEREFRIGQAIVRGERKEFLVLFRVTSKAEGVAILRRVLDRYPTGEFADDARFTIANYYFEEGRYMEAVVEYKALRENDDYRDSEWRDVALFQIGRCEEASYQGPRYDTGPARAALESYERYEKADPEGSRVADSESRRSELGEDLAKADLMKARWYLQWNRPLAARVYLRDVVELYPATAGAEEARQLLRELEGE